MSMLMGAVSRLSWLILVSCPPSPFFKDRASRQTVELMPSLVPLAEIGLVVAFASHTLNWWKSAAMATAARSLRCDGNNTNETCCKEDVHRCYSSPLLAYKLLAFFQLLTPFPRAESCWGFFESGHDESHRLWNSDPGLDRHW